MLTLTPLSQGGPQMPPLYYRFHGDTTRTDSLPAGTSYWALISSTCPKRSLFFWTHWFIWVRMVLLSTLRRRCAESTALRTSTTVCYRRCSRWSLCNEILRAISIFIKPLWDESNIHPSSKLRVPCMVSGILEPFSTSLAVNREAPWMDGQSIRHINEFYIWSCGGLNIHNMYTFIYKYKLSDMLSSIKFIHSCNYGVNIC